MVRLILSYSAPSLEASGWESLGGRLRWCLNLYQRNNFVTDKLYKMFLGWTT